MSVVPATVQVIEQGRHALGHGPVYRPLQRLHVAIFLRVDAMPLHDFREPVTHVPVPVPQSQSRTTQIVVLNAPVFADKCQVTQLVVDNCQPVFSLRFVPPQPANLDFSVVLVVHPLIQRDHSDPRGHRRTANGQVVQSTRIAGHQQPNPDRTIQVQQSPVLSLDSLGKQVLHVLVR